MTRSIDKAALLRELGYNPPYEALEEALEEAGLSRPDKSGIAPSKRAQVEEVLANRFLAVCSRGDCQADAPSEANGQTIVPAATQADCAVCGGSANARAVDRMVAAWGNAGLRRLCVVGGSPNSRTELEALVGGRLELRLVVGVGSHNSAAAKVNLAWADRVAVWGTTQLDHSVSDLYKGAHVIGLARRSIGALALEMVRSVDGTG
jgi:hypothetical protein